MTHRNRHYHLLTNLALGLLGLAACESVEPAFHPSC